MCTLCVSLSPSAAIGFFLLAQVYNGQVVDFFTRLPSYFLHDAFHQALINRYGQQTSYILKDRHAFYQWLKQPGVVHSYGAACSLTCFPRYYSVHPASPPPDLANYRPILHRLLIKP